MVAVTCTLVSHRMKVIVLFFYFYEQNIALISDFFQNIRLLLWIDVDILL